jgi:hypothetical protein
VVLAPGATAHTILRYSCRLAPDPVRRQEAADSRTNTGISRVVLFWYSA